MPCAGVGDGDYEAVGAVEGGLQGEDVDEDADGVDVGGVEAVAVCDADGVVFDCAA